VTVGTGGAVSFIWNISRDLTLLLLETKMNTNTKLKHFECLLLKYAH